MEMKDEFLSAYADSSAFELELPLSLSRQYSVMSCLKETPPRKLYLLKDRITGNRVLLKIEPEGENTAENEYRILSDLYSEAIPRPFACICENGLTYLVREYIDGETLYEAVSRQGRLNVKDAIAAALQLCTILKYLHTRTPPVIHRDIKPQNIVLSPQRGCVLIDFGIARRHNGNARNDTVIMGSAATAAPEQFGFMQTDRRTDIYSLGLLLHFLFTGSLDPDYGERFVPLRFKRIIRKCLRFDPHARYKRIEDLLTALKRAAHPWPLRLATLATVLALAAPPLALLNINPAAETLSGFVSSLQINAHYSFKSPELGAEVARLLGKKQEELTRADLLNVKSILLVGSRPVTSWKDVDFYGEGLFVEGEQYESDNGGIATLEDFAFMPNIETLMLANQRIEDVTPLKGLPLKQLALSNNKITDIGPLSSCISLKELYLSGNPLADIQPCAALPDLIRLDLGATLVTDLNALAQTSIQWLNLYYCPQLSNGDAFKEMPYLTELCMSDATASFLTSALNKKSYTHLTLFNCRITDLKLFNGMNSLIYLNVGYNNVSRLDGGEALPMLRSLNLRNDPIADLTGLEKMKGLEVLDVVDTDITDFSVLSRMEFLFEVYCSEAQKDLVSSAATAKQLRVTVQ